MTHSIYKKNRRTCFFWERGGKSHCKQYRGEGIQMTERKTLLSELRHFNNPGWPCCTFLALPSLWPGFESHQGRHVGLSFSVPNWFWGFPTSKTEHFRCSSSQVFQACELQRDMHFWGILGFITRNRRRRWRRRWQEQWDSYTVNLSSVKRYLGVSRL